LIFFLMMMRCVLFILAVIASACLAQMKAVYMKEAAVTDGAVCLDGTPGMYYFKPGSEANSTKWILHLLGGGLCLTDAECVLRSKSYMGSSSIWPPTFKYGGPLNDDPKINPDFYDWNHVLFVYCDGACFSGDVTEPVQVGSDTIYYRGHRVLIATVKDLLKNQGLDKATDVLVLGDSAGGMATFFHSDLIRTMMPESVTRFKGMPLSGIFLDHANAEGRAYFANDTKHVFDMQNCSGGVNQRCVAAQSADEKYKCFFGQYTMEHVETPLFVVNSAYDVVGTACILGGEPETTPTTSGVGNCSAVPGWSPCEADPPQCTKEQWHLIEGYADEFMKIVENNPKVNEDGSGLFEYSCHTHAVEATSAAWFSIAVDKTILRDAVKKWYFSDNEPASKHTYKDCLNQQSYTCNPTCNYPK